MNGGVARPDLIIHTHEGCLNVHRSVRAPVPKSLSEGGRREGESVVPQLRAFPVQTRTLRNVRVLFVLVVNNDDRRAGRVVRRRL